MGFVLCFVSGFFIAWVGIDIYDTLADK